MTAAARALLVCATAAVLATLAVPASAQGPPATATTLPSSTVAPSSVTRPEELAFSGPVHTPAMLAVGLGLLLCGALLSSWAVASTRAHARGLLAARWTWLRLDDDFWADLRRRPNG